MTPSDILASQELLLAMLAAGIVAALLMKLKWVFTRVIGLVLYGVIAVYWGWYVFSSGYWEGALCLDNPLKWALAILFPVVTLICRPAGKGGKLRLTQFSVLVIVMGLAYLASVLMVNYWQLNLWAGVVFFGLPLLYVLLLLLVARVSVSNLLMGLPAAMVALLVCIGALRQSTAAGIVFTIIVYIVLGVVFIMTVANIGGLFGLDKSLIITTHSGPSATKLNYNPLDDIKERNWKNQHGG